MNGFYIAILIVLGVALLATISLVFFVGVHIISEVSKTKKYYKELDDIEKQLSKINNVYGHDDLVD